MLSRKKQFLVSVPLLIIGIGATVYVLSNVLREHTRTRGIDADIAKQEERAAEIRSKNALLEQTISYLESEEARQFNAQKIGYKEPDQEVVGVSDLTSARESIERQQQIEQEEAQAQEREDHTTMTPMQQWYQSFFRERL